MKTAPTIIVQLIHIEGPLKGQILELPDTEIKIGRHSSCQLQFPADLNTISRQHATITREGNRFKLTDHSSNGTIVNGKQIKEVFLKDGDVITISEGGPKVSFLTQMGEETPPAPMTKTAAPPPPPPTAGEQPQVVATPPVVEEPPVMQTPEPAVSESPPPAAPPERSREPLIIQFGPTLQSFDTLPVKIGREPSSEFQLSTPQILDQHGEIYFADGKYWVKDLTGQQMITINGIAVGQGAALQQQDELALSPAGPYFQFLGNGRLGEVEKQPVEEKIDMESNISEIAVQTDSRQEKAFKKPLSFLKKILSKD